MAGAIVKYTCQAMVAVPDSADMVVVYLRTVEEDGKDAIAEYVIGTISGGQSLPASRMLLNDVIEIAKLLAERRAEGAVCQKDTHHTH